MAGATKPQDVPGGSFNFTVPTADGRRLLRYDTERRGYELVDIESGQATLVTREGPDPERTLFGSHDLSPDEKWIAALLFISADPQRAPGRDNDGGRELRMFEVGGSGDGSAVYSWGPRHHVSVFGWSSDPQRVWVFVIRPDRAAEIAAIDTSAGSIEVVETLARRGHTQAPSLSPDGRFITYHDTLPSDEAPDVFLLAADGAGKVRLEHPASDSKPMFTPDGSGIVFISKRRTGFKDLWFQRVVDGRPVGSPRIVWEDVGLGLGAFNYSLHPGGSRIAFERHAGLLAQTWAIGDLMSFIRSGEAVSVVAGQR